MRFGEIRDPNDIWALGTGGYKRCIVNRKPEEVLMPVTEQAQMNAEAADQAMKAGPCDPSGAQCACGPDCKCGDDCRCNAGGHC